MRRVLADPPSRSGRILMKREMDAALRVLDSVSKPSSADHARIRKTPRQLDREIAQSLTTSGQPQLADLFADPAATRAFAREMRHELQKKQTSERTAVALASGPFTVKRLEDGRRTFFGRYADEGEARTTADRVHGWAGLPQN